MVFLLCFFVGAFIILFAIALHHSCQKESIGIACLVSSLLTGFAILFLACLDNFCKTLSKLSSQKRELQKLEWMEEFKAQLKAETLPVKQEPITCQPEQNEVISEQREAMGGRSSFTS